MVVTLVFGTILTGWLRIVDDKVNEARLSIDRYATASNFMQLIGDEESPVYLANPVQGEFATITALLDPAERKPWV